MNSETVAEIEKLRETIFKDSENQDAIIKAFTVLWGHRAVEEFKIFLGNPMTEIMLGIMGELGDPKRRTCEDKGCDCENCQLMRLAKPSIIVCSDGVAMLEVKEFGLSLRVNTSSVIRTEMTIEALEDPSKLLEIIRGK